MRTARAILRRERFGQTEHQPRHFKGKNMSVLRIAAFSDGDMGGNPAGVMITDELPNDSEMQRIAAEVGFSETAFAVSTGTGWRVRYFSPESEVPFCGHATIALGAALALRHGDGVFALALNQADITVEGRRNGGVIAAALQSPPTRSMPAPAQLVSAVLALFGYTHDDLDPSIPPALAHGGADHLVLGLKTREALASMEYDLNAGRSLMKRDGLVTSSLPTLRLRSCSTHATRSRSAASTKIRQLALRRLLLLVTCVTSRGLTGASLMSYRAKTWACALAYVPKSHHRPAARSASLVPHGSCSFERTNSPLWLGVV